MKFNFENLEQARKLMVEEIKSDINTGRLYPSKRFNENGHRLYPKIFIESVEKGDEQLLAEALDANNCFAEKEERNTKNGIILVKVRADASRVFAEGEFNRFYLRALALIALQNGQSLQIYRARHSENPRPESEMLIGQMIGPKALLDDLRNNIGVDTVLGLPQGPNSGLTAKLV